MTEVILALGSNLGDRLANLRMAVRLLRERGVAVEAVSSAWETAPVPADQPAYLNAVARGTTGQSPEELLATVKAIEHEIGRRPTRRWGPRPIDIDILFYGDERVETPSLVIPHPRIAERAFVLAPLAELVRGPLPVLGSSAIDLLDRLDRSGVRRIGPALAPPG